MQQVPVPGRRAFLAGLAMLGASPAWSQAWPERPVKLVVPFGAGSGADIVARVYADKLGTALGQPFVVENKAGASGMIAAEFVARAPADGYTLMLASQSTHASNVGMFRKLPYDPVRSFAPVSLLGSFPLILVVHPSIPARSVGELVAYAKAHPGKLTFAYGTGAAQVTGELFRKLAAADILLVPYKSNPLALTSVVAGETLAMVIDPGPSLPLIAAGRVNALAVTTGQRSSIAPQLPTMAEAGMPGYELYGWNALVAPAATPRGTVDKLSAQVAVLAADPDLRHRLALAGIDAHSSTPPELARFIEAEMLKWTSLMREAGITPE
jgi:tripartite-type tricarboxylate transporter receptor subunit TctC